jgi:putative flippase GtrA
VTSEESRTQPVPGQGTLGRSAAWFIVIGVVNNATGFALFVVLTLLGAGAIPAATASYVAGMFISFYGNRRLTFQHAPGQRSAVIRFLITNAIGYSINVLVLSVLVSIVDVPQIVGQLVAIGCVAVCTFVMMRVWVFRHD